MNKTVAQNRPASVSPAQATVQAQQPVQQWVHPVPPSQVQPVQPVSPVQQPMMPGNKGASLLATFAAKMGVSKENLLSSLTNVAFRVVEKTQQGYRPAVLTNEELLALLSVCNTYGLDPFSRQVYAFRGQNGAVQPLISVDGWLAILNRQPEFDGMTENWSDNLVSLGGVPVPEWCEITIFRKDRSHPVIHREYAQEAFMQTSPWKKYPRRMLKHRATVQCIRYAFGISGALDEESAKEADDFQSASGTSALGKAPAVQVIQAQKRACPPEQYQGVLTRVQNIKSKKPDFNFEVWVDKNVLETDAEPLKRWLHEQLEPKPVEPEQVVPAEEAEVIEEVLPDQGDFFMESY